MVAALIAVSVALVACIAAFAWLLDRRDKRDRLERAEWLQRIQAPTQAVVEHTARTAPVPEPVPQIPIESMHDDDESYWQAHGGGDLSREDLAELVAQHEMAEGV